MSTYISAEDFERHNSAQVDAMHKVVREELENFAVSHSSRPSNLHAADMQVAHDLQLVCSDCGLKLGNPLNRVSKSIDSSISISSLDSLLSVLRRLSWITIHHIVTSFTVVLGACSLYKLMQRVAKR